MNRVAHCTSDEAHDPCSCAQLSEWQMKCMNESETANWILANTRKCPKCNVRMLLLLLLLLVSACALACLR